MATLAAVRNKLATTITAAKLFNVSSYQSAGIGAPPLKCADETRSIVGRLTSTRVRGAGTAGAMRRLYGADMEVRVGGGVESRVESADDRASRPLLSIRRPSRHNRVLSR